jgi:hypothetical protein
MMAEPIKPVRGGSADDYFEEGQQDTRYAQQPQYGQHPQYAPQPQYGQPAQYQQPLMEQQYPQQPPVYNQRPANAPNEKLDFNQAFQVQRPKYNDIWAALLFLVTFAGFVVVSGIAIQGYSTTKLFQGGSIYGGASTVGLSTNTIILL